MSTTLGTIAEKIQISTHVGAADAGPDRRRIQLTVLSAESFCELTFSEARSLALALQATVLGWPGFLAGNFGDVYPEWHPASKGGRGTR